MKKIKDWDKDEVEKTYHIKRWSEDYFDVNDLGHLCARPTGTFDGGEIDLAKVIDEMKEQNISFPVVMRFHDILKNQIKELNTTFDRIISESGYKGLYRGVYPIKVNQMREVVDEIIEAGAQYHFGLEAGSKTELLTVLSYSITPKALIIVNGYKDEEFLKLALLGSKIKKNIVIVIEKLSELKILIPLMREQQRLPIIGLRIKMLTEGRGKWCGSSGSKGKFGLTLVEILEGIELLKNNDLLNCVQLIHFHIGSQITDINCVKEAINEGVRIYALLKKMGVPLSFLDVGGGLGVDYEGSKTTKNSSKNYSLKEYVSDIVYGVKQICDMEEIDHPHLVTESGRFITAYHSCIVTNVIGEIKTALLDYDISRGDNEQMIVHNMREIFDDTREENIQESFNDAQSAKESGLNAFKLGLLSLDERAKLETLYWKIIEKIKKIIVESNIEFIPESLTNLLRDTSSQYLCNFSIFQSALDSWAIGQLLPIVPIKRLRERPTVNATLVDITCDSDGRIGKYVGERGTEDFTLMHELREGETYYVGLFLTGAYQDVMGDNHNMFGRPNEVHIYSDACDPDGFYIEEYIKGSTAKNLLASMQYNADQMAFILKKEIDQQVQQGNIPAREGVKMVDFYERALDSQTYLNV